jgi:hypothetical protein
MRPENISKRIQLDLMAFMIVFIMGKSIKWAIQRALAP